MYPTPTCPLLCKYSTSGSALVTATHIFIQLFPFSCTWRWPHNRQFSAVRETCLWNTHETIHQGLPHFTTELIIELNRKRCALKNTCKRRIYYILDT